ncbi:MAG: hypothetical protein GX608_03010 [Lentisphaerae bacterium]|nr:hypothetical protein [Lentisphaerota bacterium]
MSNVTVEGNSVDHQGNCAGGGVYLSGGSAIVDHCAFRTNWIYRLNNRIPYGGAIYANGVNPLQVLNCDFSGNYISTKTYAAYGGALYAAGNGSMIVSNCVFTDNYLTNHPSYGKDRQGGTLYLSGAGLVGSIRHCALAGAGDNGNSTETLFVGGGAVSAVGVVIKGGLTGDGVCVSNIGSGSFGMTNCLIFAHPSNGVHVAAGAVRLANCTLTGNGGWGVSNEAGIVETINCIAWTNGAGGFTPNCALTYTCSQEAHDGAGNKVADPLFAGVATNNFHLTRGSPCVNAGLNGSWTKADADLDGKPRVSGGVVDMGPYELQMPSGGTILMIH